MCFSVGRKRRMNDRKEKEEGNSLCLDQFWTRDPRFSTTGPIDGNHWDRQWHRNDSMDIWGFIVWHHHVFPHVPLHRWAIDQAVFFGTRGCQVYTLMLIPLSTKAVIHTQSSTSKISHFGPLLVTLLNDIPEFSKHLTSATSTSSIYCVAHTWVVNGCRHDLLLLGWPCFYEWICTVHVRDPSSASQETHSSKV